MEKTLALFTAHLRVCIAEDEANRREEVTLSRSITADNDVRLGGKGLNDRLVLVATALSQHMHHHHDVSLGGAAIPHLLKPWMMICLIYMVGCAGAAAQHPRDEEAADLRFCWEFAQINEVQLRCQHAMRRVSFGPAIKQRLEVALHYQPI